VSAMHIRSVRPVVDYLKLQGRFRHLFEDAPEAREELQHLQQIANHNLELYALRSDQPEALDSESADTARRGGLRWS